MNRDKDEQFEPICRFGPGGDFVQNWPPATYQAGETNQNPLSKVLASLSEIIAAMLGSEPHSTEVSSTNIKTSPEQIRRRKERLEYAVTLNKADAPADPAPVTNIKGNFKVQGQPMLFPDDWRAGRQTGHKPKHRVRAHRRTPKKRPAFAPSGGTLFEANFKSAKTA